MKTEYICKNDLISAEFTRGSASSRPSLRTCPSVLQCCHGTRSHEVLVAGLTFEILIKEPGTGQRKSIQGDKNSVAIRFRGKVHPKVFLKLAC